MREVVLAYAGHAEGVGMAKAPAKVFHVRIGEIEGVPVVIFGAKDSAGRSVEACIPVAGWDAVSADVSRRIAATANAATPITPGQWAPSRHQDAEQMKVGTTDDGKVLLIARLGLPDEVRLSMPQSTARDLAAILAEEASREGASRSEH